MLALPIDRHIVIGIDAVFCEKIAQGVFRRRALARRHDGLALQVGHGVHALAVFHDVENAERVDRQHLDLALRLIVEHGGEVRGHAGHVELALEECGRHFVRRTGKGKGISIASRFAAFAVLHQLHKAHGRRALERGDGVARRGKLLLLGLLLVLRVVRRLIRLLPAGGEREDERKRQAQGQEMFEVLFHWFSSFPMLPSGA